MCSNSPACPLSSVSIPSRPVRRERRNGDRLVEIVSVGQVYQLAQVHRELRKEIALQELTMMFDAGESGQPTRGPVIDAAGNPDAHRFQRDRSLRDGRQNRPRIESA